LKRHQQGLELLSALPAVFQMILDQGHCFCSIYAYKADLGKAVQMLKALPATDLVWASRDHFLDDLFQCVSI
jgi:hypothetical protein